MVVGHWWGCRGSCSDEVLQPPDVVCRWGVDVRYRDCLVVPVTFSRSLGNGDNADNDVNTGGGCDGGK